MSTHGSLLQGPTIRLSQPIYDRLQKLKLQLQKDQGRSVTYAEVIEQLLERQP